MKKLHPKIQEIKQRAAPISYGTVSVNQFGEMVERVSLLDQRIVEGYACIWGDKNSYGEIFVKGAFSKSIKERGPGSTSNYQIKFLNQHSTNDPLSLFEVIAEDEIGLYFKTMPLDDVPSADRLLKQIRSGTINNFSYGWDYIWDKVAYNDEEDALMILEAELYEISAVSIPAGMNTYAIRSADLPAALEELADDTEDFIKSIPRKQQLELRQLITRHKSLAKVEPPEQRQKALDETEPVAAGLDYKQLLNLKIFD